MGRELENGKVFFVGHSLSPRLERGNAFAGGNRRDWRLAQRTRGIDLCPILDTGHTEYMRAYTTEKTAWTDWQRGDWLLLW
jgi:hypothetical protein